MASDGKDYKTDITADPSAFEAGMKKAAKSAADASKTIDSEFKKIGDTFTTVTKYLAGFTAVLAGGGALKKFISDANDWNGEAGKMSKQLGITTEQASVLNVALNHLGLDSSVVTDAAMKLSKNIQSNGQAFDVLGVKVRDTSGAYRPVTEVMGEVNAKLAAIHNPIEQNIAGMQVYGKGWSEIRATLKLTAGVMSDAEIRAKQLNLIVGPEGVAMSKQYSMQMKDLNLVGKSLEIQFGNQLLPVFTRIGKFMSEEGPAMGKVFGTVLEGIAFAASSVWIILKDLADALGSIAAYAVDLLTNGGRGFSAIGKARDEEAAKNRATFARMREEFGKPLPAPKVEEVSAQNEPHYRFKEKAVKVEKDPNRMSEWEANLADEKASLERKGMLEGQFREMSKAREMKYWQDLKSRKDLNDQERIAVTRKTADVEMAMIKDSFEVKIATLQAEAAAYKSNTDERLRIEREIQSKYQQGTKQYEESAKRIAEIQRQAAEQERAVNASRVQADRDARLQTIALEEQALQTTAQLGLLNQAQLIESQAAFEERRNAIALEALKERERLALADPDKNIVEIEKINTEKEALERAHQLRLGQIRQAQVVDAAKYQAEFFGSMQSSLQASIQNVLNGTNTLANGFRSLFASIGQALAQTASKMAADWLMGQIKMRLASKQTSLAQLNNQAAVAAGGAYDAVVGTPFVGPILAPAAAAVAYAGVMAFGANTSAAGGYDIPGNINPIVQTHAREMILPAKHADVIRNIADKGQGAPSGLGDVHMHVHTQSTQDFANFLSKNSHVLAPALRRMGRNFSPVGA